MVTLLVGGKGSGKTHRLVKEALANNGIIVCATGSAADYIRTIAKKQLVEQGKDPWQFRTRLEGLVLVADQHTRSRTSMVHSLYVDNLPGVLNKFLGPHVVAISADWCVAETAQGKRFEPWEDNPHV